MIRTPEPEEAPPCTAPSRPARPQTSASSAATRSVPVVRTTGQAGAADLTDGQLARLHEAAVSGWRTITVRIPPEDLRYQDGWWVNSKTGACINGALAISDQPREHLDLDSVVASLTEPAPEVA